MKFRPIHYYDLAVNVSTAGIVRDFLIFTFFYFDFCAGEIFTWVIFQKRVPNDKFLWSYGSWLPSQNEENV